MGSRRLYGSEECFLSCPVRTQYTPSYNYPIPQKEKKEWGVDEKGQELRKSEPSHKLFLYQL